MDWVCTIQRLLKLFFDNLHLLDADEMLMVVSGSKKAHIYMTAYYIILKSSQEKTCSLHHIIDVTRFMYVHSIKLQVSRVMYVH